MSGVRNIKIKDPWIAKEPFEYILNVKSKVDYKKWVEFIESNSEYFIWLENTEKGKKTLSNLDKIPDSFKQGIVKGHNKMRAFAEPNSKGEYKLYIDYNDATGVVGTTFQKPITVKHIRILLDLANHLDAYLLNNGTEIIDENYLKKIT